MKKNLILLVIIGSIIFGVVGTSVSLAHGQVMQQPNQTKAELIAYLKERIALLQQLLSLMIQLENLQKRVIANQSVITPPVFSSPAVVAQPSDAPSVQVQEEATTTQATTTQAAPVVYVPVMTLLANGVNYDEITVEKDSDVVISWNVTAFEPLRCEASSDFTTTPVEPVVTTTVKAIMPFNFTLNCVGTRSGRSSSKTIKVNVQ